MVDFISTVKEIFEQLSEWATLDNSSLSEKTLHIEKTGFWVSVNVCFPFAPFVLLGLICMVWSIANVGPVRKTLSTIFILALFPLLYTILVIFGLIVAWKFTAIVMVYGFTILAPLFLLISAHYIFFSNMVDFMARQASITIEETRDVTFGELVLAVVAFVLSLPTTGVLVGILTLFKSPLVIISNVFSFTFICIKAINEDVGCSNPNSINICAIWLYPLLAFGLCIIIPIIILSVMLSILGKIALAGLWPAYVASGWIRSFNARRREPSMRNPLKALNEARNAAYNVIWFSDAVTNLAIKRPIKIWRLLGGLNSQGSLWKQFQIELNEFMRGERRELSTEVQNLSMLPSPTLGTLWNGWQVEIRQIARQLRLEPVLLKRIWKSFFTHCQMAGQKYIENGLLTKDYLMEMPPAATIGLSQLAILGCITRTLDREQNETTTKSKFRKELVLHMQFETEGIQRVSLQRSDERFTERVSLLESSPLHTFVLTENNRPKGHQFLEQFWRKTLDAKKSYSAYQRLLAKDQATSTAGGGLGQNEANREKEVFESIILCAGESFDYLPDGFQEMLKENGITNEMNFETEFFHDVKRLKELKKVRNLLQDLGLMVAQNQTFKNLMMYEVINPLVEHQKFDFSNVDQERDIGSLLSRTLC